MAKRTLLVEPADMIRFATGHFNIEWNDACAIVRQITPECECKTYDYEMDEVEESNADDYWHPKCKELLIEFMKSEKVKKFTLTQ
jgi:hypothetical protein